VPGFFANQFNVCASTPINFTNKTTGTYTSFFWDFGDGDTSNKRGPQHYFLDTGFMDIKLIAYNNGCSDSVTLRNYVYIKPPIVKIRSTFNCDSPYTKNFEARFVGEQSYIWDFGDGTTSTTEKFPSHTYTNTGTYTVKLSAVADACSYEDTVIVHVIDEHPVYSFNSAQSKICRHDTLQFNVQNYNPSYITSFSWDYGDGTQSAFTKSDKSSYVYNKAGTYYPKLITLDIQGCYDTVDNGLKIDVYGPQAAFISSEYTCVNFNVNFTDESSTDGLHPLAKWIWDYGDGKTDTLNGSPFTHVYNVIDTFNIKLKVIDSYGCADTLTRTKGIITIPKPNASFNVSDTINCFSNPVSFKDVSQGQVLGSAWQFGDGDTSSQSAPVHNYSLPGSYTVTLIVGNQKGCSDTAVQTIRVVPLPNVDAGLDTILCLGQSLTLQPTGASVYTWTADASLSCTSCTTPLAHPLLSTKYFVSGTDTNRCTATDSIIVVVKQPINVLLQNSIDTICSGKSVQLSASGAEIYTWQPSAGLSNPNISNPIASPPVTTTYTVTGTDSKGCFTDTAILKLQVAPSPTFNIIDTNITLSAGSLYVIKTTSSADVIKWQWSPPTDLSCVNCPEPQTKGNKIIEYTGIAYNSYGCSDTDFIKMKGLCNSEIIFIPNTFSPNGDHVNDRFFPRGNGLYLIKSMRIFNRLGQAVFERTNFAPDVESEGWDGTFYSKKLPSDVYIYFIEIMCNNGVVVPFKGSIMLLY